MRRYGFTIVELLIVIVVIAILAAITIVAYNGIQNRAKQSAAQTAASQANKKILAFAIDNADSYPLAEGPNGIDSLSALGIANNGDTSYQYTSSAAPKSFCITATNGNQSYYISNTVSTPTSGSCAGHGVNGVAAVTNYAVNPSAAQQSMYWSTNTTNAVAVRDAAQARTGSSTSGSIRLNVAVTGSMSGQLWDGTSTPLVSVTPGETVMISAWIRSSVAGRQAAISHRWRNNALAQVSESSSTLTTLTTGWTRMNFSAQVPASTTLDHISFNFPQAAASDSYWIDDVMVTKGSALLNYADGDTNGWAWNGASGVSTSRGVPQ